MLYLKETENPEDIEHQKNFRPCISQQAKGGQNSRNVMGLYS
jgi:hypothetical protein